MTKPIKPQIKSFLIADMVIQEHGSNKWSAIGIFDRIYAQGFPYLHNTLALYIKLSDAEGSYDIRVEFCDENDRKIAIFKGIKLSVPSRLNTPDFGIRTRNLQVPKPGQYCFNLYFNDEFVQGIPIKVDKIEIKKG